MVTFKGKAIYLYPDTDVTHVKPTLVVNEGLRQFRFVEIARCHDGSTAADLRKKGEGQKTLKSTIILSSFTSAE